MANAIRALAMDAVQKAASGHPGMPMGMAEIAVALWTRHLRHNPADPAWPNRDRFVLSNGHGSMLLYALLHLSGYELPMDELRRFRQLHSKTPGHPEYGATPGVETTTGPLGQGLANAVGMAIAERVLAAEFNRPGFAIVDHHTYVFMGDGCMMEGVSHEACALAGALGLGKLIALYDNNGISIDSEKADIRGWYRDDVPRRFEAYGWHVIRDVDGHDVDAVDKAIGRARRERRRPSLVCCRTVIARGAPNKANTGAAHGAPLGEAEIAATRAAIGWPYPPFEIPAAVYRGWDAREAGARAQSRWQRLFRRYERHHPVLAQEWKRRSARELPGAWKECCERLLAAAVAKAETVATRKASQNAIESLAPILPELFGGSADLTGSNLTFWSGSRPLAREAPQAGGNYVFYGVREFGMSAIMNGIWLHAGLAPYGGTFLTFSDYARNAVRMAAMMGIGPIFVYSHDSIGLGEDGPTHQPVEQAASLRLIPNLEVWRPADSVETLIAWMCAVERALGGAGRRGPTALLLSRQNLPFIAREPDTLARIRRGGYVVADAPGARALLIATGSEVQLALDAARKLGELGIPARVVSMPCTSLFDRQDAAYRNQVLLAGQEYAIARVAVEAGVSGGWHKYLGGAGAVVGLDRFGESAPANELFPYFGFTADAIVDSVKGLLRSA
ncbi:MAG: transketolase [Burkholderiales bacterium]|nr:transketolase [Burkholderiales bacterium]